MTTPILAGLGIVAVVLLLRYGFRSLLGPRKKGAFAAGSASASPPVHGQPPLVASQTPASGSSPSAGPTDFTEVTGLTKAQAEQLLDWLEANGYQAFEVSEFTPNGYTVRYRQPAA